jgi:hypothetical protein
MLRAADDFHIMPERMNKLGSGSGERGTPVTLEWLVAGGADTAC